MAGSRQAVGVWEPDLNCLFCNHSAKRLGLKIRRLGRIRQDVINRASQHVGGLSNRQGLVNSKADPKFNTAYCIQSLEYKQV